jgi:signal transduction histidine kinase
MAFLAGATLRLDEQAGKLGSLNFVWSSPPLGRTIGKLRFALADGSWGWVLGSAMAVGQQTTLFA